MAAPPQPSFWTGLAKAIGPGLLLAGAAIGVSHLVQSTRAGAEYRFALLWVLVLACATKYPFLEFGPRYAAATGENLIGGYARLGRWALWVALLVTLGSMFIIMAALTLVTAALAAFLLSPDQPWGLPFAMTPTVWSVIVVVVCIGTLVAGRYPTLDRTMKVVMALLLICTIIAVVAAFMSPPRDIWSIPPPSPWTAVGFAFVLAFMGWMPIPIDSAIWHSLWIESRRRQTGHRATPAQVRFDFNQGYILAGVVAILFVALGALIMYGSGEAFAAGGAGFAAQLISMYGQALGGWSVPVIGLAAFLTMFGTTLVVLDAFPRVMRELCATMWPQVVPDHHGRIHYAGWVLAMAVLSMVIIVWFSGQLVRLIDVATTLSFLTAPVFAILNYRVVTGAHTPERARPGRAMRAFCAVSIAFLIAFSAAWVVMLLRRG